MYLIVTPAGDDLKSNDPKAVYDYLYTVGVEPGNITDIQNLTTDPLEYLDYGGYIISNEDGRRLKRVTEL